MDIQTGKIGSPVAKPKVVSPTMDEKPKPPVPPSSPPIIQPPLSPQEVEPKSEKVSIEDKNLILSARLANPDLAKEDAKLVLQCFALVQEGKSEEAKELLTRIVSRIVELAKEDVETYDGKRSLTDSKIVKRIDAMLWAVDGLADLIMDGEGKKKLEESITRNIVKGIDGHYLTTEDRQLVKNYLVAKKEYEDAKQSGNKEIYEKANNALYLEKMKFIEYISNVSYTLKKEPLGSSEKIEAYRRASVLYYLATAIGIPHQEIDLVFNKSTPTIGLTLADITKEELGQLACFTEIADSPEKVDDYEIKPRILLELKKKQQEYLNTPLGDHTRRLTLGSIVWKYIDILKKFGVSQEEIISNIPLTSVQRRGMPLTAEELKNIKGTIAISPYDLPKDIKMVLQNVKRKDGCTYWDALIQEVKAIYLTSDIKEPRSIVKTVGEASGLTFGIDRSMWIDIRYNINPETIAHELEHIIWFFENFDKPELLKSIPDERNAFLAGARVVEFQLKEYIAKNRGILEKYERLAKQGENIPAEIEKVYLTARGLAGAIYSDRMTGMSANEIMGYPADDISLHNDPAPNLPSGDPPDLDTYLTNLFSMRLGIAGVIKDTGLAGTESEKVKQWYENILDGKVSIEGELMPDSTGKLKSFRIWLIDSNGKRVELSGKSAIFKPLQKFFGIPESGMLDNNIATGFWLIENSAFKKIIELVDMGEAEFIKRAFNKEIPKETAQLSFKMIKELVNMNLDFNSGRRILDMIYQDLSRKATFRFGSDELGMLLRKYGVRLILKEAGCPGY